MKNIYPIIVSSIAGGATILGNILLFIPIKYKDKILSFSFGLSFIVMLLISLLELIPGGLNIVVVKWSLINVFLISLFLLILGFLFIKFIDKKMDCEDSLYRIGILSMISLLIHNIPEGILCAITTSIDIRIGLSFSLAILIHNIPEGICISLPIYYATKSKTKAFIYTLISGGGEIVGALITMFFLRPYITPFLIYIIFMITAGIMISLSVLKVFKEGIRLKQLKYFYIGILVGVAIIYFTL